MTTRVGMIVGGGPEAEAAWDWLVPLAHLQARRFEPAHLEAALNESDVVWLHGAARPAVLPSDALRDFVERGGGLLLTLQAARLVGPLGFEAVPPNDCREDVWSHERDEWWSEELRSVPAYPHVRGIATYGPHPLVAGLHNGTYCWAPTDGEAYAWACYSGGAWPADGRVVAVERAYIVQNPERVVAWEYAFGRGRVLCVGAFVHFAAPDALLRVQLEQLVHNAIVATVGGGGAEPRTWWPSPGRVAAASGALALPAPLECDGALPVPAEDPLTVAGAAEHEVQFDLAGRRAVLVGSEQAGIREVWVHPHRAVASWAVRADGDLAAGTAIEAGPDAVARTLETPGRRLLETSFVALEHAVALVDYRPARKHRESVGRGPAGFEVELLIDVRRMWPFAAGCGGNLRYRARGDGRVALVESESDDGVVGIFLGRPATVELEPATATGSGSPAPAVRCLIRTALGDPLLVAVVGGASRADFDRTLRSVRRLGVSGLVRQRVPRGQVLSEARVAARTGDPRLDRGLEWAKRRLDAFLADVPGVGRSLLAGYAASRPGWGDGRPGYAWFFGRDACWSGFALLAAGEFSLVRQVIRFLGDRQDVTGKVLHEATTSGQFHFDAADATPLYLLLVARYLAWSGDREFVASVWPHVERAYRFCLSTDTDDDGLIENTRVGHGWIESGPLGGARVTMYLAAVWHAALRSLARAAEVLGQGRLAADCWARAARVTSALEDRFYDPGSGRYALDLRLDGSITWTQTALQAVPVMLRAANPVRARAYLEKLAGPAFSAPWGVRMLPIDDPLFSQVGYHSGTVWPLYTGWASLAEYQAGMGDAGFVHLAVNAGLACRRQRGAFDEALHALEDQAAGVCSDQAWSAGMVLLPFVEGLLGVEPDAPGGRLTVAPQLPREWTGRRVDVRGVRCGESAYDFVVERRDDAVSVRARRSLGPGLRLALAPWCPALPIRVEASAAEAGGGGGGGGAAPVPLKVEPSAWGDGFRCQVELEPADEIEVKFVLR